MEQKLTELVGMLQKAHEDRLLSVILYGSGATGDHNENFSDLNVMCVLTQVGPRELAASEPVFHWWRKEGNPAPLLMSEQEVQTSTDCFPMEFHDMQERRRILHGKDVIANLQVDTSFYRAQVEHELRAKLLRLRQKAGGVLSDNKKLLHLMLDSVSTFCVLGRHALLLSGAAAGWQKRDIVSRFEAIGVKGAPFEKLLTLRDAKPGSADVDAGPLFADYLSEIEKLVDFVDRLAK